MRRLIPLLPPGSTLAPAAEEADADPERGLCSLFSARVDAGRAVRVRIYDGRRLLARCGPAQALQTLESALRLKVAEHAPGRVFVHAGVVGWGGRAILIPGASRSGKTTLVAALVRAGASYLSDEFAPLDAQGLVHPFAKPLTIRGPAGCDLHARRCRAADLGGADCGHALPVGLVAITAYEPRASWQPTLLTRGQAIIELLANTVPARLRPEASIAALERALAGALVLRGLRDEAEATAHRLLEALDRRLGLPNAAVPAGAVA